jgi:sugar transferase EpsL
MFKKSIALFLKVRVLNMLKRIFDLFLISIGFFIVVPIYILVALILKIKLGQQILFKQTRPGLNGKNFIMYKFRTMSNEYDIEGKLLSDELRLTKFGKFLRSSSLDEIPELWNVIKGDMSLVGPRPLLEEYIPLYTDKQFQRHNVRPGITGWAQVNGRNAISWEEKFELDLWYVDNQSIWLDIKILFLTVVKVIKQDSISPVNSEIMPKFKKNEN